MADQEQGNIKQEYNSATVGLNMDQIPMQIKSGTLTYALNAAVENFDNNGITYQNEPGNELCIDFPEGYVLIGKHLITEQTKLLFFLANPKTNSSEIGYMVNNDCVYHTLVNAECLAFDINHPIHKVVHKITNCTTEIYWTDGYNPRRYLDIDNIPYQLKEGSDLCNPEYDTSKLDCNQLKIQPIFNIPQLDIVDVINGGNLISGTYQFAIQYSDASGNPFTSYYSITNPVPIGDSQVTNINFNYPVGKSIVVNITNLDVTGLYQYFNIAVIKTINAISSVELVGTYFIETDNRKVTYSGQSVTDIKLAIADIFEKFPYYEIAQDLTTAQDILIWDNLSSIDRINYQQIANKIKLQWETWRIPATENYADELNATNLRGYLRDEVYAFEIAFLLNNGKQTDGFHIPGRQSYPGDEILIPNTNQDFIGEPTQGNSSPVWKIYNTAIELGTSTEYSSDINYKGPYKYGDFAYWRSEEYYPCNEDVWGDLAGQYIRHHKFPDVAISPIFESKLFTNAGSMVMGQEAIFPIGVKVDIADIKSLINASNLTAEQKSEIVGFKLLRGDRSTNSSIVGKGILRNVNSYTREDNTYYFPNYPYNDLREDPFINKDNNAFADGCERFVIKVKSLDGGSAIIELTDCNLNKRTTKTYTSLVTDEVCSLTKPVFIKGGGTSSYASYDTWKVSTGSTNWLPIKCAGWRVQYNDVIEGLKTEWVNPTDVLTLKVVVGTTPVCVEKCEGSHLTGCDNKVKIEHVSGPVIAASCITEDPLPSPTNKYIQIFNSPETSFNQPFLGDVLKLESVIFGKGKAHFTEVKDNAKYRLISEEAQRVALDSAAGIASITGDFNVVALFTAYQSYLTIYLNGITRKNYAYSFNSIASYDYSNPVPNGVGEKQRPIETARYLIPSVLAIGDDKINNYQRESSVFIKTDDSRTALPFPDSSPMMLSGGSSIVTEESRFTISEVGNCGSPGKDEDITIVSYYASLKKIFDAQWGQIYSYDTIDTGFQNIFSVSPLTKTITVFGGDTFISRFAFKTKVPFFIDNRVGAPDDSDIFYDEIGNIAYPKYWHSSRSVLKDYSVPAGNSDGSPGTLVNYISYKAHNFDCTNVITTGTTTTSLLTTTTTSTKYTPDTLPTYRTYYDGYFYLFAYGIPNFYCETSYNLDLRQAYNNREGDFWPHVSSSIPDDWVQEKFVSIINDNTYYYNTTYSKQNKENLFTHLPPDWEDKLCYTHYPFRAIYSDAQNVDSDNRVNAWRIYRALSYYDLPQNFGKLTSLDGIQNRAILARFENKTLMYGNLLTIDTSNPQAAYVGNPTLFKGTPPIDFAETDLGYVGSQHKLLLKIPQGQVTIDAKRGQVFIISGTEAIDISAYGSGVNRFLTDNLSFQILKYFPNINIDNHFNGIGLHGVYDAKYDRVIITKLDYIPNSDKITFDEDESKFYRINEYGQSVEVFLNDVTYFCNKSWTLSYNVNTKTWISFHSYIPNWYIAENNFFYSGVNGCCTDIDFLAITVPTNTSTTTRGPINCRMEAHSILVSPIYDCEIIAHSELASPTTTTTTSNTTICERPSSVDNYQFIIGYSIPPDTIDSTGSDWDACQAINVIVNNDNIDLVVNYLSVYALDIVVGNRVYADNSSDDCECIPNGWYTIHPYLEPKTIIHVENCYITEIINCSDIPDCGMEAIAYPCGLNTELVEIIPSTTTSTTTSI